MEIAVALMLLAGPLMADEGPAATNQPGTDMRLSCLLKFVRWPDEARSGRLVVCSTTAGREKPLPEEPLIDALRGDFHRGTPELRHVATVEEMRGCHVVVLGPHHATLLHEILPRLAGPVLTISSIAGFSRMGGIVEVSTGRVQGKRIIVNTDAARRSGLILHSGLLAVANVTQTGSFTD